VKGVGAGIDIDHGDPSDEESKRHVNEEINTVS
jgi:hypothetical protein